MNGSLGHSQPLVSLREPVSKAKSGLGSHAEHFSIAVFTSTEQAPVHKPDASVVEPMCWLTQLLSLPRADPAMPSHPPWEQCLGRCKGKASFIQREKLLLLSVKCVGEVSRAIMMDPPQMCAQGFPGCAQAPVVPVLEAALLGTIASGSP